MKSFSKLKKLWLSVINHARWNPIFLCIIGLISFHMLCQNIYRQNYSIDEYETTEQKYSKIVQEFLASRNDSECFAENCDCLFYIFDDFRSQNFLDLNIKCQQKLSQLSDPLVLSNFTQFSLISTLLSHPTSNHTPDLRKFF